MEKQHNKDFKVLGWRCLLQLEKNMGRITGGSRIVFVVAANMCTLVALEVDLIVLEYTYTSSDKNKLKRSMYGTISQDTSKTKKVSRLY